MHDRDIGTAMRFATAPFHLLFRYREILLTTTINEIRQKHAGSAAGLLWVMFSPLLLMSLYALIYLFIFRIQAGKLSIGEYILYIFSGVIPFLGFTEALNQGSNSLVANKAVLLNTVFPAELLPVRSVLASQGGTAVGLTVILVLALALDKFSWTLLVVPVIWLALLLFTSGLVWLLSLASLVLRDVQQVLAFVSISLLVITPIAYTLDMVSGAMKIVIYANPLSYFVIAFHDVIVFEKLPPAEITAVLLFLTFSVFSLGFWLFQRGKRSLFDYA